MVSSKQYCFGRDFKFDFWRSLSSLEYYTTLERGVYCSIDFEGLPMLDLKKFPKIIMAKSSSFAFHFSFFAHHTSIFCSVFFSSFSPFFLFFFPSFLPFSPPNLFCYLFNPAPGWRLRTKPRGRPKRTLKNTK